MVRLLKKIRFTIIFTHTFEYRKRALVIYTFFSHFAEYKRAFDKDHALNGKKLALSRLPVQVNYLGIPAKGNRLNGKRKTHEICILKFQRVKIVYQCLDVFFDLTAFLEHYRISGTSNNTAAGREPSAYEKP